MSRKLSDTRHDHNTTFDRLMVDADKGKLDKKLSGFMTRPAYSGTSLEQKKVSSEGIKHEEDRQETFGS